MQPHCGVYDLERCGVYVRRYRSSPLSIGGTGIMSDSTQDTVQKIRDCFDKTKKVKATMSTAEPVSEQTLRAYAEELLEHFQLVAMSAQQRKAFNDLRAALSH